MNCLALTSELADRGHHRERLIQLKIEPFIQEVSDGTEPVSVYLDLQIPEKLLNRDF